MIVTHKAVLCFLFTIPVNSCVVQLERDTTTDLAVEKLASRQQLNCTVRKGTNSDIDEEEAGNTINNTHFLVMMLRIDWLNWRTSRCEHDYPVASTAALCRCTG